MQNFLKEKILVKDKWIRGFLMLFFVLVKSVVTSLINLIALLQFVLNLFSNIPNLQLLAFSTKLNLYLLQIVNFLTYNSEIRPFPFSNWTN